jgi:sugar/nucleoside kinase (ribokinase family)
MQGQSCREGAFLAPGKLYAVGPAVISTGGAVANTGIALHRLGLPVRLLGKVGSDLFGGAILEILRRHGRDLAESMIVSPGATTSYSVVINPPEVDRTFLHCPGANDTFCAADLADSHLDGCGILHFGYPPLMKRMYADGGRQLQRLLARAKRLRLTTSLDMAMPDPTSDAGRCDWPAILSRVLPQVDFFLPSLEETLQMLHWQTAASQASGDLLGKVADRLLGWGTAAVALKLGQNGLYLKTTRDERRLASCGAVPTDRSAWLGREMLAPCFRVKVAGTTGAGDCTIAGFLAALVKGFSPQRSVTAAVAVGACNVERPDASSGIISWPAVQRRIRKGWARLGIDLRLDGWRRDRRSGLWLGPTDGGESS